MDYGHHRDTAKSLFECLECSRLWQEHQDSIEGLQEVRILVRLQDLEAQERKYGRLEELHQLIKLLQEPGGDLKVSELADEVGGVLVVLRQQTQCQSRYRIVAPALVQSLEQAPVLLQKGPRGRRGGRGGREVEYCEMMEWSDNRRIFTVLL